MFCCSSNKVKPDKVVPEAVLNIESSRAMYSEAHNNKRLEQ